MEQFNNVLLTGLLQIAYISYYFMPISLGTSLFLRKKQDDFDSAVFTIALCFISPISDTCSSRPWDRDSLLIRSRPWTSRPVLLPFGYNRPLMAREEQDRCFPQRSYCRGARVSFLRMEMPGEDDLLGPGARCLCIDRFDGLSPVPLRHRRYRRRIACHAYHPDRTGRAPSFFTVIESSSELVPLPHRTRSVSPDCRSKEAA